VNERWVCKRCFADNDDTNAACHRCGLTRGADASQADQAGWAAQPGAPVGAPVAKQQGGGWTRFIRYWWIPAVVIVVAVGFFTQARRGDSGEINSGGTVSVDDLRAGDCFNSGDEDLISEVNGIPCSEVHDYEVFALVSYDAPEFPSDAELDAVFTDRCAPPFSSYVGEPYDTSELWGTMITPSEDTWADGDRAFICVLYQGDPDNPDNVVPVTGSMQGATR